MLTRVALGQPLKVLRHASAEGRTTKVVLHTPGGTGAIWLRNGFLVDAVLDGASGERALFQLLSYGRARWQEEPNSEPEHQRLHVTLPELERKLEMRRRQWAELISRLPPLSAVLEPAHVKTPFAGARGAVLALINGKRPLFQVLDESGLDAVAALSSVQQLLERGIVRAPPWYGEEAETIQPAELGESGQDDAELEALHVPAKPQHSLTERPERLPNVGRYEILERIGRGGTATVYLCRVLGEGGFSRRFAMKVLRQHLSQNPESMQMLLREACLTGRLHHPNVVSVIDVGNDRGQPYLVMDYVPGCSLAEIIAAESRGELLITPQTAAAIALDALAGLHAAHTLGDDTGRLLGLVHQDISPENLLVGFDGVTRVTDFGVAHVNDALAPVGHLRGKPQYLAPERITSGKVDRRADIFSLGVIFYRLLTGLDLFDGETTDEVMQQVLYKPVSSPSSVGRGSHPAFDPICLRALERDPDSRYQSAEHFRGDLLRTAVMIDQLALASEVSDLARQASGQATPRPPGEETRTEASMAQGDAGMARGGPTAAIVLARPRTTRSREAVRETQVLVPPKASKPLSSWAVAIFLLLSLGLALALDALSDSSEEPPALPTQATPPPQLIEDPELFEWDDNQP